MRAASHREAMPPFCSAALDHLLAIRRTHALQESVRKPALAAIRLIGSLHGHGSFKTVKRVSYVSRVAMSSIGLRLGLFPVRPLPPHAFSLGPPFVGIFGRLLDSFPIH